MKQSLTYLLVLVLAVGCQTDTDVLKPILGDETAHFQGNSIGDQFESVKGKLTVDNALIEANSIFYEQPLDDMELGVNYDFDENRLYSIQVDLFFAEEPSLALFEKSLSERYTGAYGKSEMSAGFKIWNQQMNDSLKIEYMLADESIEFGQPKLSLTIYNFEY